MTEVFMPKAGMDMKEGRLIRWLKEVGEHVERDEPIMEIETDKITMEAESPATGVLLAKLVGDGATVPVLQTVGYIGQPGEKIPEPAPEESAAGPASGPEPPAVGAPAAGAPAAEASEERHGFVPATPYARALARERGVALDQVPCQGPVRGGDVLQFQGRSPARMTPLAKKYAQTDGVQTDGITGTGYGGKVTKSDVLAAKAREHEKREPQHIQLTPMRRAIARNMFNSLHSMAQTSDSVEVDVTELVGLRKRLAARQEQLGVRITINDLLSYAAVKMLRSHPLANASFQEDEIVVYPWVNLSMAVATDHGLTSPVVHDADRMSLTELSGALHDLTVRAREHRLKGEDQTGGTFTLTNMGIFPVDNFNPILPAPQSCILGFGRCVDKPAVWQGEICIRTRMVLSVTYDHRVFDGGEVGAIMRTMKEYLETPELFLIQ